MAKRTVKAKNRKAARASKAKAGNKATIALGQPVAFLQDSFKSFLGYFK